MAVDREFGSIYKSPVASFGTLLPHLAQHCLLLGCLLSQFGTLWGTPGPLWGTLGYLLGTIGVHLLPFGLHLGAFGVFWVSRGCLELHSGTFSKIGPKLDAQFRAFGPDLRSLRTKYDLPEFAAGCHRMPADARVCPRLPAGIAQSGFWHPSTRAGGQDDVSLPNLLQNITSHHIISYHNITSHHIISYCTSYLI